MKKERAITLIALVITVIVLLILAGVAIATLTGDNGIITKATTAKEKTNIGTEKDLLALAYNSAVSGNYGNVEITDEQLQKELDNQGVNATVTRNSPLKITFNDSGNSYTIDEKTGEIIGPTIPYNPEKLTIGTNVKNNDKYGWKVKNYTVTTDEFITGVWRLFFQDSQYAYLITDECVGSYMPSDYYTENTDKYGNGSLVSTEGQKLNPMISELFQSNNTNLNIQATAWLTDTKEDGPWAKYKNGDCVFAIGSPTVELFAASYNNRSNKTSKLITPTFSSGSPGYENNTSDNWLNPGNNHGIYSKSRSSNWWLASPNNDSGKCLVVYGYRRLFLGQRGRLRQGSGSPFGLHSNIYIR